MRKGQKISEETRQKMRESKLKKWQDPEYKKRMSDAHLGISPSNKGIPSEFRGEKHPMFGKKHTPEAIEKIKLGVKNKSPISEETRGKLSIASSGENNPFYGKSHTSESKEKMSESRTGIKRGPHSLEHRRKISEANKGSKSHKYIDGKGKERAAQRVKELNMFEYREWRKQVFVRDNYTCQCCGKHGVPFHADHIKPWRTHPEERYNVSNGRTLCVPCHRQTDTYGARLDLQKQIGNN